MLTRNDDGTFPLSQREYNVLRWMFGVQSALDNMDPLKERLATIKGGWRDACMLRNVHSRLLASILCTVPSDKRKVLRNELKMSKFFVELKGAASRQENDVRCVSESALLAIMDRAIEMDCTFCTKSLKEGRKCELYRAISDCLPHELVTNKHDKNSCPLAGSACLEREGE